MNENAKRLRILLFVGVYLPGFRGGGPIRTVANLIHHLGREFEFLIFTSDRDLGADKPYDGIKANSWSKVGDALVLYLPPSIGPIVKGIRGVFGIDFDVVYLNSCFSILFSILPLIWMRIFGISSPLIIAPRGEFSLGALGIKTKKKRFFLAVCSALGLHRGVIWHASSEFEAQDIRRVIGAHARVCVAVDLTVVDGAPVENGRENGAPLRIVTISRVSPMKNLLDSLEILKKVKSPVKFDIYGPLEDKVYWGACLKVAGSLPENVKFSYCGELSPSEVSVTLNNYDLFLLPTLGENFGHVIAEALSSGLPVLISDRTPWRKLEDQRVGWDLPINDLSKFAERIEECSNMLPAEYSRWRNEIRVWAAKKLGSNELVDENRMLFLNYRGFNE